MKLRLHARGVFLGFKRGQRTQHNHTSLIRIEGVKCKEDTDFYLGKRVAYIFRGKKAPKTSMRLGDCRKFTGVIWGRIARPHGSSGVVRAKFAHNLPPKAMGATCRVMLYPSRI